MFPSSFFVAGQCYPAAPRPLERIHEEWQRPCSYAWFCPVCAEIWARCVVANHSFMVWTHVCEAHKDMFAPSIIVPGSLLIPLQDSFNESLPLPLWQREVELHIRHYTQCVSEIES